MQAIKRKRVTRVGSGAFSIYLPKKWIDAWPEAQQESREIDLHQVGDGLLIMPAHMDQVVEMRVPNGTRYVEQALISAYVRGATRLHLTPLDGSFDSDCITAARDRLRHMDERLVATCTPDEIGFHLHPDLPPPATDANALLTAMGAKVQEMLRLTAEAVNTYSTDPDRALHAMQLMLATHREDVSRLLYQAVRIVARIEIPMETVSDFQYLDLVAADLERLSGHSVRIAQNLLEEYGLGLDDLEFPRSHLLSSLPDRPPAAGMARELIVLYRRHFEAAQQHLGDLLTACQAGDVFGLLATLDAVTEAQPALGDDVFVVIKNHWGENTSDQEALAGFSAVKVSHLIADVYHAIGSAARHAAALRSPPHGDGKK